MFSYYFQNGFHGFRRALSRWFAIQWHHLLPHAAVPLRWRLHHDGPALHLWMHSSTQDQVLSVQILPRLHQIQCHCKWKLGESMHYTALMCYIVSAGWEISSLKLNCFVVEVKVCIAKMFDFSLSFTRYSTYMLSFVYVFNNLGPPLFRYLQNIAKLTFAYHGR